MFLKKGFGFWMSGVLAGAFLVYIGFFAGSFFRSESVDLSRLSTVDMIVVLTGGRGRIKESVELLKEGKGKKLLISGMQVGTSLEDVFKANELGELDAGLSEKIIPGMASSSTLENALEIREVMQQHKPNSVLVVTSNYHMPRARELLIDELQNNYQGRWPRLYFYAVESPNFGPQWYFSWTSWKIFFSEFLKSIFA